MELKNNKEDLENALSGESMPTISMPAEQDIQQPPQPEQAQPPQQPQPAQPPQQEVSPEEEIGIHKGSLNTLLAERNELVKMLTNVELIMQAHISRLKELGIEIKVKDKEEEQQQ